MKKWLLSFVAATVTCGSAFPVFADTASNPSSDQASIYINAGSPVVGTSTNLHLTFFSPSQSNPNLEVQTTLGTLNGQGSSVTLTPSNGVYPDVSLTSTVAGQATIQVLENGVVIGSSQLTFIPGALGNISIQATPSNQVVGGTSTISITATDVYGNPVSDNTFGTTFNVSTSQGQIVAAAGTNQLSNNGSTITIGTHNGVAQAVLTDFTVGTATVTVSESTTLPSGVKINGVAGASSVNVPVNFNFGQSIAIHPVNDFKDTVNRPAYELESERELNQVGVLNGDLNHYYYPLSNMKRSEFASVVAQYMGLSTVASNLQGTQTRFADVDPTMWYDGAIGADASLGYIHGDGTNFYPDKSISYAEVTAILLNNLGITTSGTWPNDVISGGQTYGLFKGLGSFNANDPATRGDVAIMVRNAMHLVPPTGGLNTNGKTLEAEMIGYTWYGDDQPTTVVGTPGNGTSLGNELQVQTPTQTTTLHLANSIQMAGGTSLNDLMNKKIKYLTNAVGLVTYIEVTP